MADREHDLELEVQALERSYQEAEAALTELAEKAWKARREWEKLRFVRVVDEHKASVKARYSIVSVRRPRKGEATT